MSRTHGFDDGASRAKQDDGRNQAPAEHEWRSLGKKEKKKLFALAMLASSSSSSGGDDDDDRDLSFAAKSWLFKAMRELRGAL